MPPPDSPPPAPPAPPMEPEEDEPPSSSPPSMDPTEEEKVSLHSMEGSGYTDEENGHSMPNLEEARTEGAISAGGAYNKHTGTFLQGKRGLTLIALLVCTVTLIVGFSVAISQNKRSIAAASSDAAGGDPEDPSLSNARRHSRLEEVTQFLSARISDLSELQNENTPQYKAARWVADQDEANLPLPSNPNDYDNSFEFVQRYIMAVFYFSLDGANWTKKMDFLSGASVCDWNFDLDPSSASEHAHLSHWKFGVMCADGDGIITHIFISKFCVTAETIVQRF